MHRTIGLWIADIRSLKKRETDYLQLLQSGARNNALRFVQQEDRLYRIVSSLMLYHVLGIKDDGALPRNEYGKPESLLAGQHFNLSHSGNYTVLAVADIPVGVDIEPFGTDPLPQIPHRLWCKDEIARLIAEPTKECFAYLWTRLESALKADGKGFSLPERTFSVLDDGHPWYFQSLVHDEHMISCAAAEHFELNVSLLSPETLMEFSQHNILLS